MAGMAGMVGSGECAAVQTLYESYGYRYVPAQRV